MNPQPQSTPGTDDEEHPQVEGEGNYTAARRHRESVEDFVEQGRVDEAARDAEPESEEEAQELKRAEDEGREHARK